jgi:DNA (cytosine-5)-methyltransferase 1
MVKHFEGNTLISTLTQSPEQAIVCEDREVVVVDLFAGAGGVSTGCIEAAAALKLRLKLTAVNHWDIAISTHKANYPQYEHYQADVDKLDPRKIVPGGHVVLLIGAPECTHHSRAAGGMPKNDQKRASPRYILRWLEELDVDMVLIENVEELRTWGPLACIACGTELEEGYCSKCGATKKGLPIKERAGEFYEAWKANIIALGYCWEERVLNAADFGAATSRRRLFIIATKGKRKPVWPAQTHAKNPSSDSGLQKWVAAKTVIDWSLEGESIFHRKRPLSPRTIERIFEGLRRFGGEEVQKFLIAMEHGGSVDSVENPLRTITTAKGGAFGVVTAKPVIVSYHAGKGRKEHRVQSSEDPLGTLDTSNRYAVAEPSFLVAMEQTKRQGPKVKSLDEPAWTITAEGRIGIAETSFILSQQSQGSPKNTDKDAVPAITAGGAHALIQPFIVPNFGERDGQAPRTQSVNAPMASVTSKGAGNLIEASFEDSQDDEAFLLPPEGFFHKEGQNAAKSLSLPVGTITQRGGGNVVRFFVEYYNNSTPQNPENPLATATTKDRFAVVNSYIIRINGTKIAQLKNSAISIDSPVPVIATQQHLGLVQPEIDGKRLEIKFRMLQPKELAAATGFPAGYKFMGTKTEIVRQIGNAIVVPMAKALCFSLLQDYVSQDFASFWRRVEQGEVSF